VEPFVSGTGTVTFTLGKNRLPHLFRNEHFTIDNPQLVLLLSDDFVPDGSKRFIDCYTTVSAGLTGPGATATPSLVADPALAGQPRGATEGISVELGETDQAWTVTVPAGWAVLATGADGRCASGVGSAKPG
jgi:hypothetical protein